jgi:hypothetical protein
MKQNKLECLSTAKFFLDSLIFASKARNIQSRTPNSALPYWWVLVLIYKQQTTSKNIARDKHSSLFYGATTLSITTFSTMTLSIMTFSIKTFSIMTFSIKILGITINKMQESA